MQRERITDNIYVFTSELYAQVTAGLVVTEHGAVLIDTLAYPQETEQIKRFAEQRLEQTIRYVINTHFHADHTIGTYLFPEAQVIGHRLCRTLLDERGRASLESAKLSSPELHNVEVVLPHIVFDRRFSLFLGNKTLEFWTTPGHSPDSIMCHVKEDQVLFAADTLMPIPFFVDGDYNNFITSLKSMRNSNFDCVVQGHGEVILKGEVSEKIQNDLDYLVRLRERVDSALASAHPENTLNAIDIEQCGKSRILLNGMVEQLHEQNVLWLAEHRREKLGI